MKVSDQIRLLIEESISSGELLPGDAIDDVALAKNHKISRTPVREALLQLQAQGIVTNPARGGFTVSKMNLQQLLSLWELLAELEGVAVRLACERMSQAEIRALSKLHVGSIKAVEKNDVDKWQELNLQFHDLIYQGARNMHLRQEVMRLRFRTGVYRRHAFASLGDVRASYMQHEKIVQAIQTRSASSACVFMADHMRPGRDSKSLNDFIMSLPVDLLAN
jgi:DNA-binding GntR family transcriptional regulator